MTPMTLLTKSSVLNVVNSIFVIPCFIILVAQKGQEREKEKKISIFCTVTEKVNFTKGKKLRSLVDATSAPVWMLHRCWGVHREVIVRAT